MNKEFLMAVANSNHMKVHQIMNNFDKNLLNKLDFNTAFRIAKTKQDIVMINIIDFYYYKHPKQHPRLFGRFRKMSNKALSQKKCREVINTIIYKYSHRKNKCGYSELNKIVSKEYKNAGYKGNVSNDYIWVRDMVSSYLLKKSLN